MARSAPKSTSSAAFPPGFLWGTATSSHQVEGHNNNDWSDWERSPGHIRDGSRADVAADWWAGRAEEDLELARSLGQNAHRLGLEWSRLEPEPGRWDDAAAERYQSILTTARRVGLACSVTLNHFTLPRWLAARGGWLYPSIPEAFAAYAARCARCFGALVDQWTTLNEPSGLAYQGYATGAWPPGLKNPRSAFAALAQMLRAHAAAYAALQQAATRRPVGLVVNLPSFVADRAAAPLDQLAAAVQDYGFSGMILVALRTGLLFPPLAIVPTPVRGLRGSVDFLGLNYYGRYCVRFALGRKGPPLGRHVQRESRATPWNDWGEPAADGLRAQLCRLSRFGVPLYVTENGIYDNEDQLRPRYLVDHVRAVEETLQLGVDVRGYFHWTLVDNFEWNEGFGTRFGLVELDRTTGARRPRRSAEVYRAICRHGGVPPALLAEVGGAG